MSQIVYSYVSISVSTPLELSIGLCLSVFFSFSPSLSSHLSPTEVDINDVLDLSSNSIFGQARVIETKKPFEVLFILL